MCVREDKDEGERSEREKGEKERVRTENGVCTCRMYNDGQAYSFRAGMSKPWSK